MVLTTYRFAPNMSPTSRDVFTSALRTSRGRAHEALGQDAEAARDYEAAQMVAEALLQEALAGGGAR